jgi:hypothetical protein
LPSALLAASCGVADRTRGATELCAGGADGRAAGGVDGAAVGGVDGAATGGVDGAATGGVDGAAVGGGGEDGSVTGVASADGAGMGGGGADGGVIGGGAADGDARGGGGTEYAALGMGGGAESRESSALSEPLTERVGAGNPIKVSARGRMARTLPSGSALARAGVGEAVGEVAGSSRLSSGVLSEEIAELGASEPAFEWVNCTRNGCCMTRVTSFESSAAQSGAASLESSAPQSVSMSSVDGGVDGRIAGASLVGRGGTEDDNP